MKNIIVKGVLVSCVMSFIIGCSPKKEESSVTVVDTLQIKKEIQAKEDQFAATYNAREVKNIGYYDDEAISYSQNKPPLVGKTAIVEYLKNNFASKSNQLSFTTNEVFVSDGGNQVVEIGAYKVVDSTSTTINTGHYISLFVKRDGKYVCLRDMSTSDLPLE